MPEEEAPKPLTAIQLRFLTSYRENFCNKAKACKDVDIGRQTMYDWINENQEFKETMERYEWEDIMNAEQVLKGQALLGDNTKALQFFLRNKHPEYKQRVQLEGGIKLTHELDGNTKKRIDEWKTIITPKPVSDVAGDAGEPADPTATA